MYGREYAIMMRLSIMSARSVLWKTAVNCCVQASVAARLSWNSGEMFSVRVVILSSQFKTRLSVDELLRLRPEVEKQDQE
jgi:hypothetical protein